MEKNGQVIKHEQLKKVFFLTKSKIYYTADWESLN
jgi:hypothetical protein